MAPPREPLIVQVPTALMLVMAQVRREKALAHMRTTGIKVLIEHLSSHTLALVPEVKLTNRSTKARLDLLAKVHGETLYVAHSKAEKLVFAADDTIDEPFIKGSDIIIPDPAGPWDLSPVIEMRLKRLISKRLPRIQETHLLNQGLPEGARAYRDHEGIRLTIDGLSDEGFKRVVSALGPLINLDRFNREEPL